MEQASQLVRYDYLTLDFISATLLNHYYMSEVIRDEL
jgi:hypothetical protein